LIKYTQDDNGTEVGMYAVYGLPQND